MRRVAHVLPGGAVTRCPVSGCGATFRTGTLAIVDRDGTRKRVCPSCAAGAALIVTRGTAVACSCGEAAKLCAGCAAKAYTRARGADLAPLVKKIRGLVKAYGGAERDRSHAAGLQQAADIVEAWAREGGT